MVAESMEECEILRTAAAYKDPEEQAPVGIMIPYKEIQNIAHPYHFIFRVEINAQ